MPQFRHACVREVRQFRSTREAGEPRRAGTGLISAAESVEGRRLTGENASQPLLVQTQRRVAGSSGPTGRADSCQAGIESASRIRWSRSWSG